MAKKLDELLAAVRSVAGGVGALAEHARITHGATRGVRIIALHTQTRRSTDRDTSNMMLAEAGLGTVDIRYRDRYGLPQTETIIPVFVAVVPDDSFQPFEEKGPAKDDKDPSAYLDRNDARLQNLVDGRVWAVVPSYAKSWRDLEPGKKFPVWRPDANLVPPVYRKGRFPKTWDKYGTGTFIDGLPATMEIPPFVVTIPQSWAEEAGMMESAVVAWPWAAYFRAHTILKKHKEDKEGTADLLFSLGYLRAEMEKTIPSLGPAFGTTGKAELLYRWIAMFSTGVTRIGGVSIFPELARLFAPADEFFLGRTDVYPAEVFDFEDSAGNKNERRGRTNRIYKKGPAGEEYEFDKNHPENDPFPYDPLKGPPEVKGNGYPWILRNLETGRECILDARLDPLALAQKLVYVYGWENPGDQQHFNQLRLFKLLYANAFRRIATEQVLAQVRVAAKRPGVTAEKIFKDVEAAFDPTSREKAAVYPLGKPTALVPMTSTEGEDFFNRKVWEEVYLSWLDAASQAWEAECERDAGNNLLTTTAVDKAASASGWPWNHLSPAEKAAKTLRIYRLADEVVERAHLEPSVAMRALGRNEVLKAIGNGFGRRSCGDRALVYTAPVSAWQAMDENVAIASAAGKGDKPVSGCHWQFFREVGLAGEKGAIRKIQAVLFGAPALQRRWFRRQVGEWGTQEMSLAAAKRFRREAIAGLPRPGSSSWGRTVHVVRGYPLWPKWLAIGDRVDFFNAALMTITEGARSLTGVQNLVFGGYAANTGDPEEEMEKLGRLITSPWAADKMGDNLMFFAREVAFAGYDAEKIREELAKKFGSGALHPMFWMGPNWMEEMGVILGKQVATELIRAVDRMIDFIYVSMFGEEFFGDIAGWKMHPDLDLLCEEEK